MLHARARSEGVDQDQLDARIRETVADVVNRQVTTGLDVVNDGEAGKPSYSTYVADRLTGFGGESSGSAPPADLVEYPAYAARLRGSLPKRPSCVGPVAYRGQTDLERDLTNLRNAAAAAGAGEAFMTAGSPGVIAVFHQNRYYPSHETYVAALADAVQTESEALAAAGFLLQLDCPDLAAGYHIDFGIVPDRGDFGRVAALHVEALNHATRNIAPEQMRLHLCWGNYEGPHHRDVPLGDIVSGVLRARPAGLSFEAANPRHAHEWRVWEETPLPEGKYLIPGVIDTTTNFIEHPDLAAERIVRFAELVGRERVIAGADCGLATFAGMDVVDPAIAWAKLASLVEGARLASAP
jgi:5-methyltetrahydropteroyltriglutamate--homocysteine methyltransferase